MPIKHQLHLHQPCALFGHLPFKTMSLHSFRISTTSTEMTHVELIMSLLQQKPFHNSCEVLLVTTFRPAVLPCYYKDCGRYLKIHVLLSKSCWHWYKQRVFFAIIQLRYSARVFLCCALEHSDVKAM